MGVTDISSQPQTKTIHSSGLKMFKVSASRNNRKKSTTSAPWRNACRKISGKCSTLPLDRRYLWKTERKYQLTCSIWKYLNKMWIKLHQSPLLFNLNAKILHIKKLHFTYISSLKPATLSDHNSFIGSVLSAEVGHLTLQLPLALYRWSSLFRPVK